MYISLIIILQAGDCQPNPGPIGSNNTTEPKFPCHVCDVACLWGERAICCDQCDGWYHVSCMGMNTEVFEVFERNSKLSWICCQCGMPNFATSIFSSGSIDLANSFSSLASVDSVEQPITVNIQYEAR